MIDNDPLQDRKNHESMQGLIESLQQKIKTYKKQIEEAEEIAALNLAKFRQVGPTEPFSIFSYTKDCKLSTRSKQHWEQASRGLIWTNKLWPKVAHELAACLLDQCEETLGPKVDRTNVEQPRFDQIINILSTSFEI